MADDIAARPVTVLLKEVPMSVAADALARSANTSAVLTNGIWCIGPAREGERVHLITVPRRGSATDTATLLSTLLTSTGKIATTPNGTLVLADTQDGIRRATDLLERIESQSGDLLWTRLDIVSVDAQRAFEAKISFDVAAGVALTMVQPYWTPRGGADLSGSIRSLSTDSRSLRTAAWLSPPGYEMRDQAIDQLLLPETEQSTATPSRTTRFQTFDASSTISITVSPDGDRWNLKGSMVSQTPTPTGSIIRIKGNSVNLNATIAAGSPTLINASTMETDDRQFSDGNNFSRSKTRSVKWLYVFATVFKLS